MTTRDTAAHADPAHAIAFRLLEEGTFPLVQAAQQAGLTPVPSLRSLLRAAITGRLESLKISGRRVTSPQAVARWVVAQQAKRANPAPLAQTRIEAEAVLERYGLGREGDR